MLYIRNLQVIPSSEINRTIEMKILNIMLSRDLGGLQQVFLDYDKMLKMHDIEVVNITSIYAEINHTITPNYMLPNLGNWDWISIIYLKYIISETKPDIIIAHGGRATKFCFHAKTSKIPMVGIIHSGKLKWVDKSDYIIALTKSMYTKAYEAGIEAGRLITLPNAIDTNARKYDAIGHKITKNTVLTIGTMARFVPKKAIDIFIKSLAILKTKGVEFRAIIGGSGAEEDKLKAMVLKYNLKDCVKFIGWVKDKKEFFDQIDIFCQPSIEEPFGVIVLEAMLFDKPIIAAEADGPKEIITHMKDGILVPIGSPQAMAEEIEELIDNKLLRSSIADTAFLTVRKRYDINIVGKKLATYLHKIKTSHDLSYKTKHNKAAIRTYDSHI